MSSPLSIPGPRPRVDDNTTLSLGACLGVAILVHVAFFSGLGAAEHYHLFDRFTDGEHASGDMKKESSSSSTSKKDEKSEAKKNTSSEDDRRHVLAALLPPKEPDLRFGKDGSTAESASWISYDDYQKLIAPKSAVEQPALQSSVEPLPGAPIRPDPTPPLPESSQTSVLQSRATVSAHKSVPGELSPAVMPGATAGKTVKTAPVQPMTPTTPAMALPLETSKIASKVTTPGAAPVAPGNSTAPPRTAMETVESTAKPVPDKHLPEGSTLRQTPSSPAPGEGHDVTMAKQQPGVDLLPSSSDAGQVASASPAETVVQGPEAGTTKGQPNPKQPDPEVTPTEAPTAPKPIAAPAVAAKIADPTPTATVAPASSVPPPIPLLPDPNPPAESKQVAMANPTPAPATPEVHHDPSHDANPVAPVAPGSDAANPGQPSASPAAGPNPGQLNSRPGSNEDVSRPTGAPRSASEAAPVSLNDSPLPTRPGQVISGNGIEIQTAFPQYSVIARYSSIPFNPEILVTFNQEGVVTDARITKSSTFANIDDPILASLYKWRASGSLLHKLNGPFTVKIKMLIINE